MTFLQPFILWGLPLCTLPLIIHLLNRMRYRSMKWAAMRFLLKASRSSTKLTRWKHLLILACRVLAVLFLIIAIGRPVVSGWWGWAFSGPPDTIFIVLDRSVSMETKPRGTGKTNREIALETLYREARTFEESNFVFVDSASAAPKPLLSPDLIPETELARPTATGADIPSLLETVLDYITDNNTGRSEIWVASDMQHSNWTPESESWKALTARIKSLPQDITVKLLALPTLESENISIAVRDVSLMQTPEKKHMVKLSFMLKKSSPSPRNVPVEVHLNGNTRQLTIDMEGQEQLIRLEPMNSPENKTEGTGFLTIPADANAMDNTSYFAYSATGDHDCLVVSEPSLSARILRAAADPFSGPDQSGVEIIPQREFRETPLNTVATILWSGPFPGKEDHATLMKFINSGGAAVFFPDSRTASGQLPGPITWEPVEEADTDPFVITSVEDEKGLLAAAESGLPLPFDKIRVRKRRGVNGTFDAPAVFKDGKPFLALKTIGRGQLVVITTAPDPKWSDLYNGTVLVPVLYRLRKLGNRRFSPVRFEKCGIWSDPEKGDIVDPLSESENNYRYDTGIYRFLDKTIVLNRPEKEDTLRRVQDKKARELFRDVSFSLFAQDAMAASTFQSEIWYVLLYIMLLALLLEDVLILPAKPARGGSVAAS